MKIAKIACMLLSTSMAATEAQQKTPGIDDKEMKLSQSFASAFNMAPPKMMNTTILPNGKETCPEPAAQLTYE